MTLRDHIRVLQKIAKEHPELLDKDIVYAKDDEGNAYSKVHYAPAPYNFDGENISEEGELNVVCIN